MRKTNTIIVSRSRTMSPQSNSLTPGRTVLMESDDLDILGKTFDHKITYNNNNNNFIETRLQDTIAK